jgi:hypothetical protein
MTINPIHPASKVARLNAAPRCGARTRSGKPCRAPAVRGRPKCRLHGCGRGSGGPSGARNGAWRTGKYSQAARALSRAVRDLVKAADEYTARAMHAHGLKPIKPLRRRRHVRKALAAAKAARAKEGEKA